MARIRSTHSRRDWFSVIATVAMMGILVGCTPETESDTADQVPSPTETTTPTTAARPATPTAPSPSDSEATPERRHVRRPPISREAKARVLEAARFLGSQERFRVTAEISFDVAQRDGRLLEFGSRRDITIDRPDRVRMNVTRRDGENRVLYFDGATISIDLADHQAFVRESRPGTLYAALDHLADDLDIPIPLANLFSPNFAAPLESESATGYVVGRAEIGGRTCQQLAFRLPEVDVQLWIEEGERPLVARVVITHKREPGNPQFRATLENWELGMAIPEAHFQFEPAADWERLRVESIFREDAATATGTEGDPQ